MSSIRNILFDFASLFMVRRCPLCGAPLRRGYHFICARCMIDAPLTEYWLSDENPMVSVIRSIRPNIEMASSLIFFVKGSSWQRSIHALKYYGRWRSAELYGEWLGSVLALSPHYHEVDVVVAIPVHPRRRIERGYNQSEYIAAGVARSMGIEHLRGAVCRTRYTPHQARLAYEDRWQSVEGIFKIDAPTARKLRGRRILLVDDVFTSGATMLSCADTILDSVEEARLWIATVAAAGEKVNLY